MIKEITGCHRGMKFPGMVILVLVSLSLLSYDALCAATLSRDKAAMLIEKSMLEVKTKVRLHGNGYQKGLQHGMWAQEGKSTQLTERGSQFFQALDKSIGYWENFAARSTGSESGSVTLKKPVNVRVKVTGIRGNVAEFTWEYVGLPSIVKRYVVRVGNGSAGFTLYDDGWRLTSLNYDYSREPALLTAKERTDDEKETQKWIEQQNALYEQKMAERARILDLLRESQTPNQQVAQFNFHNVLDGRYAQVTTDSTLTISDVDIRLETTETTVDKGRMYTIPPKTENKSHTLWLGNFSKTYIKIKSLHTIAGEESGDYDLFIGAWNWMDRIRFNNKDEATKVYETLLSANDRWHEKYKDIVGMVERKVKNAYLEFPESLTDSAWEKFGK